MDAKQVVRDNKLKVIANKDRDLFNNISNLSELSTEVLIDIANIVSKPLDNTLPKLIEINKTGLSSNCEEEYINSFNGDIVDDGEEIVGEIWIGDLRKDVDIAVKRAVKALLDTGVCSNEELSTAVEELFAKFLEKLIEMNYVTVNQFLGIMKKDLKKGYQTSLYKAMEKVLSPINE